MVVTSNFHYGKSIDTLKDTQHEEIFLSFLQFIRSKLYIGELNEYESIND